jgi:Tfp pilus assembly protein PilX
MTMARHNFAAGRNAQRGITLIIGMILLVLATLVLLATFHLSRNNTTIVGNAQQRADAVAAAQQTIEAAVNSPLLTSNPASIFTTSCPGQPANTLCYDVNGDGRNDVVAQITPPPACIRAQVIPLTSLDVSDPADAKCTIGVNQGSFGKGGGSLDSSCANSVWDIRALAQNLGPDGVTPASQGPKAVLSQGIAKRVGKYEIATACP